MDAIEEMIVNPTVAMGLGDSGAHVGQIMDASSPTWRLTHWVKTRSMMSLEEAIRRWTSDTAAIFGVENRGVIREGGLRGHQRHRHGQSGDGVAGIQPRFSRRRGRFVQRGCGYDKAIVNGQVFMERGEHTGALAGVTLRS